MAQQLEAIGGAVKEEDMISTLLNILLKSFENLLFARKTQTGILDIEYITSRLLHEAARWKEIGASKNKTPLYLKKMKKKGKVL